MQSLRRFIENHPKAGWGLAALLLLVAAVFLATRIIHKTETDELTQIITIRDSETGDTWQVPRGVMEKELYLRHYPVDPNQGLINPKTGKPNGFPVDAWKQTVARINGERSQVEGKLQGNAKPPTPPQPAGGG
jgi:hypothetical protein